jgi:hypothetical protein
MERKRETDAEEGEGQSIARLEGYTLRLFKSFDLKKLTLRT